jgi:hypoxanthine phosphoribosyltransferase
MDILAQSTSIPMPELTVLTNLKYDPTLQQDTETSSQKISWANIDSIVNQLYAKIKETKQKFTEIYTISRGGLIPARLIADKLDIKIIHVDKDVPDNSLFIDDIYDSGKTFDDVTKGNGTILFGTLFGRTGTKFPENTLIGQETIGNEYIVFPWDKQEYSRMQKLNS